MTRFEKGMAIAMALVLAGTAYVVYSRKVDSARQYRLEVDVMHLSEKLEKLEASTASTSSPAAKPSAANTTGTATAAADLAAQVSQVTAAIERLEKTAESLDARITRSRLAVPSDAERKAQIKRGEARLEEMRKSAAEARENTRKIAEAAKLEIDPNRLLEPGANPALESNAEFVAARDAATAQERVVTIFERKLQDLHFSTVVEALPPQEGR